MDQILTLAQQLTPRDYLIVALLVVILLLLAYLCLRPRRAPDTQGLTQLQNQLQGLSETVDRRLNEGTVRMFDGMQTLFGQSQRLATDIRDTVHRQLVEVAQGVAETRESTKQVFTIAEQIQNLERVLKHQKQRGNLGEQSLKLILDNVLPPDAYTLQYQFPGGETVDAVILAKEGLIPIDAKFPLDNYLRIADETDDARRAELETAFKGDLKRRIDETAKYVQPDKGTLPFAFMFIPAEGIYYDLMVNEVGAMKVNTRSLIDYAYNEKKVIIVSPTTFAAYLQSVLYGFKAFKVEETAKEIARNVENLSRHLRAYEDYFRKLGASLSTAVNHYNAAYEELNKIDKDVLRITGESPGFQPARVERPQAAE
jgi:DNA recombination protein RmuC